jgi:hypothetical protein
VVVDEIDIDNGRPIEPEDDSPISSDTNTRIPLEAPNERVEAIPRRVQLLDAFCRIEHRENLFGSRNDCRADSAAIAAFIETAQTSMSNALGHTEV